MKKIPTIFLRDPDNMRYVLGDPHPDCGWVFNEEGVATRKYDGTCMMFDGKDWWARRQVKPGKDPPANFQLVEHDPNTGKSFGWVPSKESGFKKFLDEATESPSFPFKPGTYELVGPKINGNPEEFKAHTLIRHADAQVFDDAPTDFEGLYTWLKDYFGEGLVWHHPDGRMAKIKKRDFRYEQ